tara:strand:- start:248 stop:376 length:129 start_codon:yes stop_codon:yes gene_type:complete
VSQKLVDLESSAKKALEALFEEVDIKNRPAEQAGETSGFATC